MVCDDDEKTESFRLKPSNLRIALISENSLEMKVQLYTSYESMLIYNVVMVQAIFIAKKITSFYGGSKNIVWTCLLTWMILNFFVAYLN